MTIKDDPITLKLNKHVEQHESFGCSNRSNSLGIQRMPEGYALMLDGDAMYFYWLRFDGNQSCIHWNKWAVRKGAMIDTARTKGALRTGVHVQ
jgi:hypothetical protein